MTELRTGSARQAFPPLRNCSAISRNVIFVVSAEAESDATPRQTALQRQQGLAKDR
jgi:hypothetical protein